MKKNNLTFSVAERLALVGFVLLALALVLPLFLQENFAINFSPVFNFALCYGMLLCVAVLYFAKSFEFFRLKIFSYAIVVGLFFGVLNLFLFKNFSTTFVLTYFILALNIFFQYYGFRQKITKSIVE